MCPTTYAGGLAHSYHGRDLKVSGVVLVRDVGGSISMRIVDGDRPVCTLPFPSCLSCVDELKSDFTISGLSALFSLSSAALQSHVAALAGVAASEIVGGELLLVDARPATVYSDFVTSPRLDNLASSYAALRALVASEARAAVNVCAVFDAEEIGSRTHTGGASELLGAMLRRVCAQCGEDYTAFKSRSLFVSADAGHAPHPNYPEKGEQAHRVPLGDGVALKEAYNSAYCFDLAAISAVANAARDAGVLYKFYCARNGRRGGGTIGTKVEAAVGIRGIDVGHVMQAMHSHREIMAWRDVESEVTSMTTSARTTIRSTNKLLNRDTWSSRT